MKDYRIYIFISIDKDGYKIETELYASTFYQAWDAIINIFPYSECIDIVGMEDTCMPALWGEFTNQISLTN